MAVTAQQLADETSGDLSRATRVLPVAVQAIEDYAPDAPDVLKDEAVIRFAGYLLQADYGTVMSETLGPKTAAYTTNHAAAFRNSGAAMLVSRYRVRRAGAIG